VSEHVQRKVANAFDRVLETMQHASSTSTASVSDNGPGGTADYGEREDAFMEPVVLFGIQFTLSLAAYALIGFWYVAPRLSRLPREIALAPLLWIHAFRVVGGTILAPGAVDAGVPMEFRVMVGYGDLATAFLALLALIALRGRFSGAIPLVWLCVIVGMLDTVNAIVQSVRDSVFAYPLGVNWVIVTMYVPALLVSSLLIFMQLLTPKRSPIENTPRG